MTATTSRGRRAADVGLIAGYLRTLRREARTANTTKPDARHPKARVRPAADVAERQAAMASR
jgi:hypothetical protein